MDIATLFLGVLLSAIAGFGLGMAWHTRKISKDLQSINNLTSHKVTHTVGRFNELLELLRTLGSHDSGDFLDDDFNVSISGTLIRPKLYALYSHLEQLGFGDLAQSVKSTFLGDKKITYGSMEYLHHFIIPEIRRQIRLLEAGKGEMVSKTVFEALHGTVRELAQERFAAGHFADAVEASLKEVNSRVKAITLDKLGQELDGARLMSRALSPDNPVIELADLTLESGRSIQAGFLQIFSGAMTGVRNPKAHANVQVDEVEAIHLLFLAGLLMLKLDRRHDQSDTIEPRAEADA